MPIVDTALSVRDVVSIDLHAAQRGGQTAAQESGQTPQTQFVDGLPAAAAVRGSGAANESANESAGEAAGEAAGSATAAGTANNTVSSKGWPGAAVVGKILARLRDKLGTDRFDRYFAMPAAMKLGHNGLQIAVGSTMLAQLYDTHFRAAIVQAALDETGWPTIDLRFVVDPTAPAYAPGAPGSRPISRSNNVGTVGVVGTVGTVGSSNADQGNAGDRLATAGSSIGGTGAGPGVARRPATSHSTVHRPSRTPVIPMRLADLVVGEFNRLGYDAATRAAHAKLDNISGVLLVIGPCGQGKTALLAAAAYEADLGKRASVRFVTAETFMNEFLAALRAGALTAIESFRKGYRQLDLLCIDDVHVLGKKTATQAELQYTIDAITSRGGCVFASAMAHPRRLAGFSQHLTSRLVAGLVAEIGIPEPISLQRAARALLRRKGLLADEQCVSAIVASLPRAVGCGENAVMGPSMRDVEGQVHKVEAVARLMGSAIARAVGNGESSQAAGNDFRTAGGAGGGASHGSIGGAIPIGLLVVQRALGSAGPITGSDNGRARGVVGSDGSAHGGQAAGRQSARAIRVDGIIATVCDELRVVNEELASKGRHPRVVLARAIVVLLAKRFTNMSYPEIARAIGRPNHSTVITALQRLTKQIAAAQVLDGGERYGAVEVGLLCEQLARRVQERA